MPENRERLFFHKMAPPNQAWITHDTLLLDFTHQPLLAVGELPATETHWKAPGTGPMHCSLCMLLSHKAPLAHSYIHRPWKCPNALCLKGKKKTSALRLFDLSAWNRTFLYTSRVLRSRSILVEVVTWPWDAIFFTFFFFFSVHLSRGYLSLSNLCWLFPPTVLSRLDTV